MDIKAQLNKFKIIPDPLKDQFFLNDEKTIRKIVDLADLNKKDIVLEIGSGTGALTGELAKKSGKVVAFEIDPRFKRFLTQLPKNVEVHFEDVHKYASQGGKFKHKKIYNKVVSNIPYSIGEWLLHNLAFIDYDKVILLVAKKFASSIKTNPVFSSFYKVEEKFVVSKEKFYPQPKTDSVVIELTKLPDPAETRNLPLFLRQFIYKNEDWKIKNSLREGLIKYHYLVYNTRLTKKEAKKMIKKSKVEKLLLEGQPDNPEIYEEISNKFS